MGGICKLAGNHSFKLLLPAMFIVALISMPSIAAASGAPTIGYRRSGYIENLKNTEKK